MCLFNTPNLPPPPKPIKPTPPPPPTKAPTPPPTAVADENIKQAQRPEEKLDTKKKKALEIKSAKEGVKQLGSLSNPEMPLGEGTGKTDIQV
jgi:hypothetical protein